MTGQAADAQGPGPQGPIADPRAGAGLTIGDLARRTGVATGTLRMWESRHGFPRARRLPSGHRRFDPSTVDAVREVVRRRDAGARLELAIAEVAAGSAPARASVFAELRRLRPALGVQRLRKSTLVALSHALEDECCARAAPAHVFGAFQRERHFEGARARWEEIARSARSTVVFADFAEPASDGRLATVPLAATSPMAREWVVVCDAPDLPSVLAAWELPGQSRAPDRSRTFETIWSLEPVVVRHAARVCAQVAHDAGTPGADELRGVLAGAPHDVTVDPLAAGHLFSRVLGYVDA